MNFFSQIHASITQPQFYRTVRDLSTRQVSWFVFRLIVVTALLQGAIHTWQSIDMKSGVPFFLSRMMQGISLNSGELVSEKGELYAPPTPYVRDLFAFISATPERLVALPDSAIVIDVRESIDNEASKSSLIRLMRNGVEISNGTAAVPIEYTALFGSRGSVNFTSGAIRTYLVAHIVPVAFFFVFFHLIKSGADILFALFFLSFAAYIFRQGKRNLVHSVKIASFAISPIAVVHILEALSMTRMAWTGQAALLVSSVVLFQALRATGTQPKEISDNNAGE